MSPVLSEREERVAGKRHCTVRGCWNDAVVYKIQRVRDEPTVAKPSGREYDRHIGYCEDHRPGLSPAHVRCPTCNGSGWIPDG